MLLESKSKLPTVSPCVCHNRRQVLDQHAYKTQINVEAPKRRRIPIEIVEPKAERSKTKNNSEKEIGPTHISAASSEDLMKPLSSRPLTTTATPPSTAEPLPASSPVPTPAPSTPHTFKDLQQTRQSTKPSRAGGGIFRSSGEHTIVSNGERGKPALGSKLKPEKEKEKEKEKEVVQSPMSLFEFTRAWESLAKSDVEGRWQLLNVRTAYHILCGSNVLLCRRFHPKLFPLCFKRLSRLLCSQPFYPSSTVSSQKENKKRKSRS